MTRLLSLFLLAGGCSGAEDTGQPVEPIETPDDAAARGVPVGVQTHTHSGVTLEVWYPAPDAVADQATEPVDFTQHLPASFTDHIGEITLPAPDTAAVRDAAIRNTGERLPVIVFSHGFGGFRQQSFDLTVHLASRGYIVVAPDHEGRMIGDVLPCLFSPPLDGCDLSGFVADPAVDDIPAALDWLASAFAEHADMDRMGLAGHSAGGNSTTTVGDSDARFLALLPMAGGGAVARDVPALFFDASCDGFVSPASTLAAARSSTDATHVRLSGGGHLAFSNICDLELENLAATHLDGRDDLNQTYYEQLLLLGIDGCPGAAPLLADPSCEDGFLDLDTSDLLIRAVVTQFFDQHLRDTDSTPLADETLIWSE